MDLIENNKYLVRLSTEMSGKIESELIMKGVYTSYKSHILKDLIVIRTSLSIEKLIDFSFFKTVELCPIGSVNI